MKNGRGASATSEEEREAEGRRRPINTAGRAHTHSSPNRGARHRRRHPPAKRRVFLVPLSKIKRNVSFWPPARKMPRIRKRRKRETLFYYRFRSFFDRCLRFDKIMKKKNTYCVHIYAIVKRQSAIESAYLRAPRSITSDRITRSIRV